MFKRSGTSNTDILIAVIIVLALVVGLVAFLGIDTTGRKGSGLGEEFAYDLSEQRQIDPELILYNQSGEFAVTLKQPRGIAVDSSDKIYVSGDNAISIFDQQGNKLSEIKLSGAGRSLAIDDEGTVYVILKDHVEVYDKNGLPKESWETLTADAVLTSIAVQRNDIFVADAGNRIVYRYDTTGKIKNSIGRKDQARNIPGFIVSSPYFDLAVASDGLLRVVNPGRHRIEAYTFDGHLEFFWGKFSPNIEGFCGCCNPVNFAMLKNDGFVTCEKGLTRIKIYDADGLFVGVVAGPDQFVEHDRLCGEKSADCTTGGLDVAVDGTGRILILDPNLGMVRIFVRK